MSENAQAGTYTVKKGDSFSKIAKELGIRPERLQDFIKANSKVDKRIAKNPHMIGIGWELVVPEELLHDKKTEVSAGEAPPSVTANAIARKVQQERARSETVSRHERAPQEARRAEAPAPTDTKKHSHELPQKPADIPSFSSASEAAKYYINDSPFLSIVMMSENARYTDRVHFDPAKNNTLVNIGFGYCVTARLNEYKRDRVFADLTGAGLPADDANLLIDIASGKKGKRPNLREVKDIHFPIENAIKLVQLVENDYRSITAGAYGKGWDKMNDSQKAAATYLSYKNGKTNPDMVQSAHRADWSGVKASVSSKYLVGDEYVQDERVVGYIRALMGDNKGQGRKDFMKTVGLYDKDATYIQDPVYDPNPAAKVRHRIHEGKRVAHQQSSDSHTEYKPS